VNDPERRAKRCTTATANRSTASGKPPRSDPALEHDRRSTLRIAVEATEVAHNHRENISRAFSRKDSRRRS